MAGGGVGAGFADGFDEFARGHTVRKGTAAAPCLEAFQYRVGHCGLFECVDECDDGGGGGCRLGYVLRVDAVEARGGEQLVDEGGGVGRGDEAGRGGDEAVDERPAVALAVFVLLEVGVGGGHSEGVVEVVALGEVDAAGAPVGAVEALHGAAAGLAGGLGHGVAAGGRVEEAARGGQKGGDAQEEDA